MKISIYSTLAALTWLCISCNKKLTEYNPTGLTASTITANTRMFESLVNAVYSYNRFWYGKEEGYSVWEMGTDIWTNGTGDVYPQLSRYDNLQGSNTAALTLIWNNIYAAINLCNMGITHVNAVPDMTAALKTTREAELRFLRAFYYWHVVETWGGVHFTTIPNEGYQTEATRKPVDSFYNQIFIDLQFAVSNLPATSSDYGRATAPAAKAFLARMYLTRGRYAEAIAMANDVIKNYSFILQPRYGDLWSMGNLKSKEVIWALDYSTTLTNNDLTTAAFPYGHARGSNSGHMLFLMVYDQVNSAILARDVNNGRPFNRYMPTRAYLDLFNDEHDSRYAGSFQTVWYANKAARTAGNAFNNKDTFSFSVGDTVAWAPRVAIPAAVSNAKHYTTYDISRVYGANGIPSQRRFYPSLKKFKDSTRTAVNEAQSARDVFLIRLAEMYLVAAEAELNINKLDSAAYYLNILRRRAAWPGHEADMEITAANVTLDFILDERAREMGGEQMRWFDLHRTGKLEDRISRMNPDAKQYVKPFHNLRPIPQGQLDAVTNKGEFTQNQGYQ